MAWTCSQPARQASEHNDGCIHIQEGNLHGRIKVLAGYIKRLYSCLPLERFEFQKCAGHEGWIWRVKDIWTTLVWLNTWALFSICSYWKSFYRGRFAAAFHHFQYDCWVMNVVPVSGFNTLPVIYDRGLIGVMHDWYGHRTFVKSVSESSYDWIVLKSYDWNNMKFFVSRCFYLLQWSQLLFV